VTSKNYKVQLEQIANSKVWTKEDIIDMLSRHFISGWRSVTRHFVQKAVGARGERLEAIRACIVVCQLRECGRHLWEASAMFENEREWDLFLRCFFTIALSQTQQRETDVSFHIFRLNINTLQEALAAWW
jgi:hypothetical protein